MKDILGREIPSGSLVLGMIVSRDSDGMRFGIAQDTSVIWRYGTVSKPRNVYFIENPSEQEILIKQEVGQQILKNQKEVEESERLRKEKKRIPKKELAVGGYYKDDKGDKLLYFGKCKVVTYRIDGFGREYNREEKVGYGYLESWRFPKISRVKVVKNPYKLVDTWEPEESKRVDMSNLKETESMWIGDRKITTEIILEDSNDKFTD